MEIRIVIFLAFVSVTVISNTLLIWFVYKAFANVTSKVTETVSQFETSRETKEWLTMLQSASEGAISATEATKATIAGLGPVLDSAGQHYRETLTDVDAALKSVADEVAANAIKLRDVVAKPAFSIVAFAAAVSQVLDDLETEE